MCWLTDGHEGFDLNHVSAKWRHLGPSWNRHTHQARLLQLSPATRFTINVGTRLHSFCSRRLAQDVTIGIMAGGRTACHDASKQQSSSGSLNWQPLTVHNRWKRLCFLAGSLRHDDKDSNVPSSVQCPIASALTPNGLPKDWNLSPKKNRIRKRKQAISAISQDCHVCHLCHLCHL